MRQRAEYRPRCCSPPCSPAAGSAPCPGRSGRPCPARPGHYACRRFGLRALRGGGPLPPVATRRRLAAGAIARPRPASCRNRGRWHPCHPGRLSGGRPCPPAANAALVPLYGNQAHRLLCPGGAIAPASPSLALRVAPHLLAVPARTDAAHAFGLAAQRHGTTHRAASCEGLPRASCPRVQATMDPNLRDSR